VTSFAAALATFLPMSLPSKPTKGTGCRIILDVVVSRDQTTPASLAALGDRPGRWSGRAQLMAMPLAPAEDGVIHQAHAQVRVELGVELLRIGAQLLGRVHERSLKVNKVLLIGALV